MSNDASRLSSRDWQFLTLRHFGPWGIVAALCWIVTLIVYLKQPAGHREISVECLGAAITVTAICVMYGVYKLRRVLDLLHNGIEVEGVITSFGTFRTIESVRVNCSYEVNGTTYAKAWSGPPRLYELGDKVALIVDPRRPTVCEEKASIYCEYKDSALEKPDSWKWWYYVLLGMVFGAAAIFSSIHPDFLKPDRDNHCALAELYRLVGNWGIAGLFGVHSLLMLWIGIIAFSNQRR